MTFDELRREERTSSCVSEVVGLRKAWVLKSSQKGELFLEVLQTFLSRPTVKELECDVLLQVRVPFRRGRSERGVSEWRGFDSRLKAHSQRADSSSLASLR